MAFTSFGHGVNTSGDEERRQGRCVRRYPAKHSRGLPFLPARYEDRQDPQSIGPYSLVFWGGVWLIYKVKPSSRHF